MPAEPAPDRGNRAAITVCVILATLMQALDTTIANVALPYMQGSVSASQDQIDWVLTSYIVAAAIMTPPTGYLAGRFGLKRLFLVSVAGFTVETGALTEASARAIEERSFRERFRREWIVAVASPDGAGSAMLLAVDRDQRIVGADRNARTTLLRNNHSLEKGVSLWAVMQLSFPHNARASLV
jgi:Major Facilitator Superfamily